MISYRAWIVPLRKWADEINMEFTSYGIPPLITACMQGRPEYTGDEIIIEQYTGLKDKNGKGIYEGDILDFDADEWGAPGYTDIVEWGQEECEYLLGGTISDVSEYRAIIGNIHENPELLENSDV